MKAEGLPEAAERPEQVNLDRIWQERSERFRTGVEQMAVQLRLNPTRREELAGAVLAVLTETSDTRSWLRLRVTFQDLRHAVWALWALGEDAEALAPASLRAALHDRAAKILTTYQDRS